jgi:hypothetical protein
MSSLYCLLKAAFVYYNRYPHKKQAYTNCI